MPVHGLNRNINSGDALAYSNNEFGPLALSLKKLLAFMYLKKIAAIHLFFPFKGKMCILSHVLSNTFRIIPFILEV